MLTAACGERVAPGIGIIRVVRHRIGLTHREVRREFIHGERSASELDPVELALNVAVFTVFAEAVKTCSMEQRRVLNFRSGEPGLAAVGNQRAAPNSPLEKARSSVTRCRSDSV